MKQERIEIHDMDDLEFCFKEYALADDATLTSDALHLKYSLLRVAQPLVDARVQLLARALMDAHCELKNRCPHEGTVPFTLMKIDAALAEAGFTPEPPPATV